jgi:hypothetical protein
LNKQGREAQVGLGVLRNGIQMPFARNGFRERNYAFDIAARIEKVNLP